MTVLAAIVIAVGLREALEARLRSGVCAAAAPCAAVLRLLLWVVRRADAGEIRPAGLCSFIGGGGDSKDWWWLLSPLSHALLGRLATDDCAMEPELAALCRTLAAVLQACARYGTEASMRAKPLSASSLADPAFALCVTLRDGWCSSVARYH
eukprot:SAG11_NODE_1625_length_4552_cov_3.448586_2_plen_152_part_00